jgi:hypothetical protein
MSFAVAPGAILPGRLVHGLSARPWPTIDPLGGNYSPRFSFAVVCWLASTSDALATAKLTYARASRERKPNAADA